MMKRFRYLATTLSLLAVLLLPTLAPAMTYAATPQDNACAAIGGTTAGGTCDSSNSSGTSIEGIIRLVINVLSTIVGVAAVIMVIFGGLRFIMAGGDSSRVASARNTILYSIVGLVVAVSGQILVHFVLQSTITATTTCSTSGEANCTPAK